MSSAREILVLGGTHGEEKPGIELVRSLQQDKIPGVEAQIGNPAATKLGARYADENLALAYPGSAYASSYERFIANDNIRLCYGYDLVVDVHSCENVGGHYAIIGERMSELTLRAIATMGMNRLLVCRASTHHVLYRYMPNSFGIELSADSELRDIGLMRNLLGNLAAFPLVDDFPDYEVFTDIEDGAVTEARALKLGLPDSLPQFTRLESHHSKLLGFDPELALYAQDWHSNGAEYRGVVATNYNFSLLLKKLRTVDDCYDADYLEGGPDYESRIIVSGLIGQL